MSLNKGPKKQVTQISIKPGESVLVDGNVLVTAESPVSTATARPNPASGIISYRAGALLWAGATAFQILEAPASTLLGDHFRVAAATAVLGATVILATNRVADKVKPHVKSLMNLFTSKKRNSLALEEVAVAPTPKILSTIAAAAAMSQATPSTTPPAIIFSATGTPLIAQIAPPAQTDAEDNELVVAAAHQDKRMRTVPASGASS